MNIDPKDRMSSIRISFGSDNTQEEVSLLCEALAQTGREIRI
jgi:cysteine sulfinate desulfinase/cysteine desulfurase-like protein